VQPILFAAYFVITPGRSGTARSWLATRAQAEAIQKRDKAEGLTDTAQGHVQGAEIMGGIEEAVQALIQKSKFFHNTILVLPVLLPQVELALTGDMLGMAAEGGGAEAILRGQGAVRDSSQQVAINLKVRGMRADGTALYHRGTPKQEFPQDAGWFQISRGGGGRPARAGRLTEDYWPGAKRRSGFSGRRCPGRAWAGNGMPKCNLGTRA
jgi:hypothetical protein